jgi:hypothetical protein
VQASGVSGRLAPHLSVYLSLAAVAFAVAALLPTGLSGRPAAVTAGVVETPRQAAVTPLAAVDANPAAPAAATAARLAATAIGPLPVPTPLPGPGS